MLWIAKEDLPDNQDNRNALGKAREDILHILTENGAAVLEVPVFPYDRKHSGKIRKLYYHYAVYRDWKRITEQLMPGDALILQYPVFHHTLFLNRVILQLQKKMVCVIGIVHDLDAVRKGADASVPAAQRKRHAWEEMRALHQMDSIIVHNDRMLQFLHEAFGIPRERMSSLEIFDYLGKEGIETGQGAAPCANDLRRQTRNASRCVIAGNLDPHKAGYVYHLPDAPSFELYGIHYRASKQSNVHYNGAYETDDILSAIDGDYGLVWDGDSPETCSGAYGQYLKYNNPHKTSLYLAAGIPVIVWEQSAMSEFVHKNQCGLCVSSLMELDEKIRAVSPEQYSEMKANAAGIGQRLRAGYYTLKAIGRINTVILLTGESHEHAHR